MQCQIAKIKSTICNFLNKSLNETPLNNNHYVLYSFYANAINIFFIPYRQKKEEKVLAVMYLLVMTLLLQHQDTVLLLLIQTRNNQGFIQNLGSHC